MDGPQIHHGLRRGVARNRPGWRGYVPAGLLTDCGTSASINSAPRGEKRPLAGFAPLFVVVCAGTANNLLRRSGPLDRVASARQPFQGPRCGKGWVRVPAISGGASVLVSERQSPQVRSWPIAVASHELAGWHSLRSGTAPRRPNANTADCGDAAKITQTLRDARGAGKDIERVA